MYNKVNNIVQYELFLQSAAAEKYPQNIFLINTLEYSTSFSWSI